MTDRRPDQEFAVAPQPVAGGRSRGSRRVAVVVVGAIAAGLVGVGWLGPRLSERPHLDQAYFTTPAPSGSATPFGTPVQTPIPQNLPLTPTALPLITRNDGGRLTGSVGVLSDAFRVVDLTTGRSGPFEFVNAGLDLVRRTPDGSYVCVCFTDVADSTRMSRTIDLVRLSPAGEPISRQKIGTLGVDIGPKSVRSISTDMDLAADGRRGLLVIGFLTDETVSYDAMPIDLGAGQIGPLVHIGTQVVPPAPPPSSDAPSIDPGQGPDLPQLYGPVVRMSPSGSHAFVWGVLQQPAVVGPTAELPIAWNVAFDDRGTPTTSTPAAGLAKMPLYCGALGFVSDVRLVAICPHFPARGVDAPLEWAFVDVNGDGSHEREIALPALQSFTPDITFDRANQIAWIWDATRLTLARIDMGTTELTSTTYPPNVDLAPGIGAPFRGRSPVWDRPVSAVYGAIGQQMVGSADGTRMYLVGTGAGTAGGDGQPASLGIFVVDPRTLALVDRWDPDANYVSVQLAFDDAVVVASGAPGIDASGANAAWDASLTFHAAQGGQILLRLGQVGNGWAAVVVDR